MISVSIIKKYFFSQKLLLLAVIITHFLVVEITRVEHTTSPPYTVPYLENGTLIYKDAFYSIIQLYNNFLMIKIFLFVSWVETAMQARPLTTAKVEWTQNEYLWNITWSESRTSHYIQISYMSFKYKLKNKWNLQKTLVKKIKVECWKKCKF